MNNEVLDLTNGDPDFDSPISAVAAAKRALDAGMTHYVQPAGLPELRASVAAKLRDENGIPAITERVVITPSAKFAIFASLKTILKPGDEVIVPSPSWVSFAPIVEICGGVPIPWVQHKEDGFQISADGVEELLSPLTRVVIVNTPSNPTGALLNKRDGEQLVELARDNDIYLISDEVYEKIIFDDHDHVSLGSLSGADDVTITINGFSKSFAMTGWRIGYVYAPQGIIDDIIEFQSRTVSCVAPFVQMGALHANDDGSVVGDMLESYSRRRTMLLSGLEGIAGITAYRPDGGFFVFVELSPELTKGVGAAEWLERETGVKGVSGTKFYSKLDSFVRLAFCVNDARLQEAIRRIRKRCLA